MAEGTGERDSMETERNWDRMAAAYEDFTSGEDSYSSTIEWPCIKGMLPNLRGKRVIDLGCGTGRFTFLLEAEGAERIVGVDISSNMLSLAAKKAETLHSKAAFIKADIASRFTERTFDFVFSSTATHYISDLAAFFEGVSALLNPGGSCILSVMNPVYTAQYPIKKDGFPGDAEWTVRYLDRRERGYIQPWIACNDAIEDFLSYSYHYTFSDYVNAITAAGLRLVKAAEPLPPEAWETARPGRYEGFIETPSYLILKLSK